MPLHYLRRKTAIYSLLLFSCACAANRSAINRKQINKAIESSTVFSQHFTGFALYDLEARKMVYEHNASRYFTPASNTKIFTFYTSLKMLGDSIPGLRYTIRNDSLIFQGTGDPTFLHPDLKNTTVYTFLNNRKEKLFYVFGNYKGRHFGPGWAWDDYNDYYSAEKSAFPVYGNVVRFKIDSLKQPYVYPGVFKSFVQNSLIKPYYASYVQRNQEDNRFTYYLNPDSANFTQDLPFRQSEELLLQLLSDTLHKQVNLAAIPVDANAQTIYSIPADSLYKRMMQESDNFIAEQLLLLCSSTIADTLNTEKAIAYAKDHFLQDLPDKPIWKDGSGLSRYNLFTPRSIIQLLLNIYKEVPQQRLFHIFPAGGQAGTIKKWYASQTGQPYVFAKTGTLENNHCLSGYLVTRKGKVLLFSFMHNNMTVPINSVRKEMQQVLLELHLKY